MAAGDATELPFRHRSRGRTPQNIALLAVGLAMIGLAIALEARPLMVYAALAAFAIGTGYLVVLDPRAGLEIDRQSVEFWHGRRHEHFALSGIARVHVTHWSDSTDVTLHLRDGSTVDIPDRCRPALRPLTLALEAAGLTVTTS